MKEFLKSLPGYQRLRYTYESLITRAGTSEVHWSRIVMNRKILETLNRWQPETLNVLEISGQSWGKRVTFKNYQTVEYPEFDICESILDETFDLIIADQVFEHLRWPYRAAKNIHQMLKPGGYFLMTTPFLIRIHNHPIDCSRWTETGIKYFIAECGFSFDRIQSDSWGNRACVRANFFKWTRYHPWFHSLKNESEFPVSVWAFAQK